MKDVILGLLMIVGVLSLWVVFGVIAGLATFFAVRALLLPLLA